MNYVHLLDDFEYDPFSNDMDRHYALQSAINAGVDPEDLIQALTPLLTEYDLDLYDDILDAIQSDIDWLVEYGEPIY